jgi:hypothetical protein
MLSSKRLLLSFALASSTLLCPFLTSAQNVSSQPPKQTSASQRVRSFGVKYLGWFERVSPDEIESRLQKKGLPPLVEKPYDQAKVDSIKAEIVEIYKEHGIAVGADSSLEPTRDLRAVRILIEVYKR